MAKKKVKLGQPDYQIIYDWSGGMNDVINPALLNDNESPRLENVSLDEKGTLYPAKGRRERYNEPFSDRSINGMGAFYKSDGTSRLVIGADDELYTDSPHHINTFDSQSELETGIKQNIEITDGKAQPAHLSLPTFTRNSDAYLPDGTKVSAGQPRFVDGKFGKGVLVEEGTENLFTANGGINLTDISYYNSTTEPTYNVLTEKYAGVNILRVNLGQGGSRYFAQAGLSVGTTYTFSILVRPTNRSMSLCLQTNEGTGTVTLCPVGKFTKLYLTFTPEASYRWLIVGSWQANDIIDFTAPQLETKSYATSFTDEIRDKEWLTIPTSIIDKDEGTIEFWVNPAIVTNYNNFFNMTISNGRFMLFFLADGRVYWDYGLANSGLTSISSTVKPNEWIQITMRWSASAGTRELFVNGNLIGSKEFTPPDSLPAGNVAIVNNYSAVVDDLRISSVARADEEILEAYQSNTSLPIDEWTTYTKLR